MSDFRATLFDRLRDPRAVPILARHAIPVIGVFVFDWSTLETIAALLLDALSSLWLVGAMGTYFALKDLHHGEPGVITFLNYWAAFLGTFAAIAAILSIAVIVPAMFLLPLVQASDVDPWTLLTTGWLPRAFAFMLACQLPGLVARIRTLEAAGTKPEDMGMDKDVGFVMHRTVMLAMMASFLAILGSYALHALVLVAQTFGAVTEIMRDVYLKHIMMERPKRAPLSPKEQRRRRRKG